MIKKYQKKPVVIEAVQWDGNNFEEIQTFVTKPFEAVLITGKMGYFWLQINTLEGPMSAAVGDFIIKGVKGEFYPCKPDIFEQTYQEVTPDVDA